MELWIPITIAAAFVQNLRFMLQKHLKGRLSTLGATFARFIFAAPLAAVLVGVLIGGDMAALPAMSPRFWAFALLGGVAQILATAMLVALFSFRNFAVGVSFSKTETVQAVLFGVLILGEAASLGAWIGILVSLLGVILISVQAGTLTKDSFLNRATVLGLGSGAAFGIAAVAVRAAAISLDGGDFLLRAAVTLAAVTGLQTVIMAVWLRWREVGQISAVIANWRVAGWVGVTGMLGSLGWFSAMTLQNVAYVRALGQVELVFTFAASWFIFRERATRREVSGVVLICLGIVALLLLG